MTREEAIKIIDCYDIGFYDLSGEKIPADKLANAFDLAIEALQFVEHFDLLKEFQSLQEVVRCKDCRHCSEYYDRDGYPYWICDEWDGGTDADGFCHYGERRSEVM